jgi:hypothetical protein
MRVVPEDGIRQHTSAYVSIRRKAYVIEREERAARARMRLFPEDEQGIRQHTSAYVSIRRKAYVSIRASSSRAHAPSPFSICQRIRQHT